LILELILSLLLLARIGVIGAALATVGSEGLVLLLLARDFRFDLAFLLPRLVRLAGVALIVVLVMLALGSINAILGMIGGALVYIGGVLIGRVLAGDDWDLLYRLSAAIPGGALILRYWKREVKLNW
jgi:O-antigen/teichoic acid export membrane protein